MREGAKCFAVGWKSDDTSLSGITNALSMAEINILSKKRCEESEDFDSEINICGNSSKRVRPPTLITFSRRNCKGAKLMNLFKFSQVLHGCRNQTDHCEAIW